MKRDLARDVGSLIWWFKEEDVDDDFAAFVEKVYNDTPAKDDPLRTKVTVETLERLWRLDLLQAQDSDDGSDDGSDDDKDDDSDGDSEDDSDDNSDEDASKRIQALIRANEPAAFEIAIDIISSLRGWG